MEGFPTSRLGFLQHEEAADMEGFPTTRNLAPRNNPLNIVWHGKFERLTTPESIKEDTFYSREYREPVSKIFELLTMDDVSGDVVGDVVRLMLEACEVDGTLDDGERAVDNKSVDELKEWMIVLADSQKRLRAFEEEHDTSWDSICYPLDPKYISHDRPHLVYEYGTLLKQLQIIFGRLIYGMPRCKPSPNGIKDCDVVSLLGRTLVDRTGEQVVEPDTFGGKYVLVLCINAPVLFRSNAFQSLLNLCNELSSERDDIKMVMVAKLNVLADSQEVFNHLLSGFPSCLAVPYENWKQRELIWKLLGSVDELQCCVVYDTNGFCLKSFHADGYRGFPYGASEFPFGAEAFPFTVERVQKVKQERTQLRKDSLENLLRPYEYSPPDVFVLEFNSTADGPQKERQQHILEVMKKKHVGLYVCCKGNLIPFLDDVYKKCKSKRQGFEIVVIYLPLLSGIDPEIFVEKIDGLLQEQNVRGWWCLPFNNSVSLRFWGLTMDYDIGDVGLHEDSEDRLIIVGPDGNILDMYGAQIITRFENVYGFGTYPFTTAAVVKNKMRKVRKLKLESLLAGQLFRGDDLGHFISADMLLSGKKKIIVYMGRLNDYMVNGIKFDYHGLVSQYKEMKNSGGDQFEVVFIEFEHPQVRGAVKDWDFGAMPWYIHSPLDGTYTSLAKKLTQLVAVQSLVGFGEDGRICSVKLLEELHKYGTPGLCLEDTLFEDLRVLFRFDEYAGHAAI